MALGIACHPQRAREDAYVGSKACQTCHLNAAASWAVSTHATTLQSPLAIDPGWFDGQARAFASQRFTPHRGDGRFAIRDHAGRDWPVHYALGVDEVQQLLLPADAGRWQVFPVGIDLTERAWFDVFPEAPEPTHWTHWTNPGAAANSQCLECHVTGYVKGYHATEMRYDSRWAEPGVGCEACHGAGLAHSQDPTRFALPGSGDAPGAGCAFCHSRRVMLRAPYLPSLPADDQMVFELLDSDLYFADGQLRGEAYEWTSFAMSRMGV